MEFHKIPEDLLEVAKHLLMILEMVEWRWTINDILDQPEQELDAVMAMKSIGEKMRIQLRNREREDEQPDNVIRDMPAPYPG